ncbi:MAG: LTA synthase family protein [Bacteroidia bacterium]
MQEIKRLFLRLGFLLLLYTLARLVFLLLNPVFIQHGFSSVLLSFWVGTWYDFSAIVYSNSFYILIAFISVFKTNRILELLAKWYFVLVNTLFTLMNLVDSAYFKFSGKRSGVDLLSESGDWLPLLGTYLRDYFYILLLLLPIPFLLNFIWNQTIVNENKHNNLSIIPKILIEILLLGLFILGARGGWGLTPLTTFDASKFAGPNFIPLTVNTGFNMIMTVQQQGLSEKNYFTEPELKKIYQPFHKINSKQSKHKNIVLIVVESLGKEYVGFYHSNQIESKTPFLDSLMGKSTVYWHAYANGKRSIEGLPSIIAAMPSLMNTDYPSSYYLSNELHGLGFYLGRESYDCSFYHGGRNGTMSFDNIVASTSNGQYFGMNEYPAQGDFDGSWGIYDDKYLNYYADELNKKRQPFYSGIFTLSSHHPYPIPKELSGLFKEGTLPIHKSIRYLDYSLSKFFDKAKTMTWYPNSVFIIVADHAAENETRYYQSNQGKFEIPIIIFEPAVSSYRAINQTISQTDIMSLALEASGFNGQIFGFGSYPEDSFAVQFHDGYYQCIQYPFVLHFDGKEVLAFYDMQGDSLLQKDIKNTQYALPQQAQLLQKLKAYLQQYSNRLIKNQTHLD